MKTFINTADNTYYFNSCSICDARCCDGTRGSLFTQIVLDDFKEVAPNFPIVFTIGDQGFIKPAILLSNGKGFCKYIKDHKCTIYEQRPSICKVYPLSPHIMNDIYIDTSCPALDKTGTKIIDKGKVNPGFYHPVLDNYQDKILNTHRLFLDFSKDELETAIVLNGIEFFKFKKDFNNQYIKLHLRSLENLEDDYFKV